MSKRRTTPATKDVPSPKRMQSKANLVASLKKRHEEEEQEEEQVDTWADLVDEVCHIEHLHEHPLSFVSDSTLDPESIQLKAPPPPPPSTSLNPAASMLQHLNQPLGELSGGFRCLECKKLKYGKVYTCRRCAYRCCDECGKLFIAEQQQLLLEIEQEGQAAKAQERLTRQRKLQNYQSIVGGVPGQDPANASASQTEGELSMDGLNSFMEACLLGDLKTVKDRIDRNEFSKNLDLEAVVETGTHRGRTALVLAAQHGHQGIVSLLLSRGADAETIDNYGMTPLMHSGHRGHLAVLNELLFAEVTVDRVAFCGYTALLFAANGGRPDCLRRLIAAGANPCARTPSGRTGLIIAALNGHIATVRYFLHHTKVDPEAEDDEGYTARDASIAMKESAIERILSP